MDESRRLLDCRDLHKHFGDRAAVDGVSFHIARGETYGLLGPNGAGKTTTISMICGLLERDGGEVTVAGRAMDVNAVEAKSTIGYVPQELAIYPDLSARENLRFFGRLQRLTGPLLKERVDAVLALTGLDERADDRVAGKPEAVGALADRVRGVPEGLVDVHEGEALLDVGRDGEPLEDERGSLLHREGLGRRGGGEDEDGGESPGHHDRLTGQNIERSSSIAGSQAR